MDVGRWFVAFPIAPGALVRLRGDCAPPKPRNEFRGYRGRSPPEADYPVSSRAAMNANAAQARENRQVIRGTIRGRSIDSTATAAAQ